MEAQKVLKQHVERYNQKRLHSAIGYLPPWVYYRGGPEERQKERTKKLQQARHASRERNLNLRQPTLPLEITESLTWFYGPFVPLRLKRNKKNRFSLFYLFKNEAIVIMSDQGLAISDQNCHETRNMRCI